MKFVFLGGQGSGKSTQAKLISQKMGLPLIEMGQLFRDKAEGDSQEAAEIKSALESGILVADNVVVNTLRRRLANSDCDNGYVLDGYPRNNAQLEGFPKDVDKIFYIKVSDDEAIKRLTERGRSDDTEESIAKRLEIYHEQTEPLLDDFRKKGILDEVDGQRPIEDIHQDILERVKILEKQQNV